MKHEEIVSGYNEKHSQQIDEMEEDEIAELTKAVVEYTNSIDPDKEQRQNVIHFLEHDKIPGEVLIESVRSLGTGPMHGKLVSERLAINLGRALKVGGEHTEVWHERVKEEQDSRQ